MRPHFLAPLLVAGRSTCRLVTTDGRVVAHRLETAFDADSRKRGLLGRPGLDLDTALVIAPCNAVHTCFMRFPIDIAFAARDGTLTKVARAVGPWRVAASFRAFATLELAPGTLHRKGVGVGDRLAVELLDESPTSPDFHLAPDRQTRVPSPVSTRPEPEREPKPGRIQ